MNVNNEKVRKFFVYGSLRPDILAPWSNIVHKNPKFSLKYYKAYLPFSKLYYHNNWKYAVTLYDQAKFKEEDKTIGYLLETDNFEDTLKLLDEIEGYPALYDRSIINCFNEDKNTYDEAYFYSVKSTLINEEDLLDIGFNDFKLYSSKCDENGSIIDITGINK